jgi:hypothetical protein
MKSPKFTFRISLDDELEQAINALPADALSILEDDMKTALQSRVAVLRRTQSN